MEIISPVLSVSSRVWPSTKLTRHRSSALIARSSSSDKSNAPGESALSLLCPLLKIFKPDLREPRPRWYEITTSGLASLSRLPYGTTANNSTETPVLPIQIYEFEACPFCRRVREAVTDLDLIVDVYPCPKGAQMHRNVVENIGGKLQFPFMVDQNTNTQLYESAAIVRYLYDTYADSKDPPSGMLESTVWTGWMPTLLRLGKGMDRSEYASSVETASFQILELYNYENNQFSRLVREVLCELELPYRCISAGKESRNRDGLMQLSGETKVPFLVDPNTGTAISDSENIIAYLINTYTTST